MSENGDVSRERPWAKYLSGPDNFCSVHRFARLGISGHAYQAIGMLRVQPRS